MKTHKTLIHSLMAFVAVILSFSTCQSPTPKSSPETPAFHPAVAAFTSGTISGQSAIRVVLAEDYPEFVEPNTPLGKKVFRFKPAIEGEAFWADQRTIEFRPAKTLPAATIYQATLLLKELHSIQEGLKNFDFSFRTIRQGFIIEPEGLVAMHKQRNDFYQLRGMMRTADFVDVATIEKMMEARDGSRLLAVSWEHDAAGRAHRFMVDSIARRTSSYKLQLNWNGSPINIDVAEKKEIEIPAKGDFKLLDVMVLPLPEQRVICRFSDPLDEKQNLEGLIRIGGNSTLTLTTDHNLLTCYPASQLTGSQKLIIEEGIKNFSGRRLGQQLIQDIVFEPAKPEVRIPGKGNILPNSGGLVLPFEAISLRAVEVRVIKLFEENIPYFLQINNLDGNYEMKRAGRLIAKKTLQLGLDSPVNLNRWNTYSLDLTSLIEPDAGAMYRIELGFKKIHSAYPCAETEEFPLQSEIDAMDKADLEKESKADDQSGNYWYYEDYYYEYYDYDYDNDYGSYWQRRNDPCYPQYYNNDRAVARNVLASDLGIIAKQGSDGKLTVLVSDLISTRPLQNVVLEARNFQNRLIAEGRTNDQGMLVTEPKGMPFLVIAKHGKQRGYLKMGDGLALPVSNFDVSGDEVQQGLKGFIYGERGVWRPGDTIFLSFILSDPRNSLPPNHPLSFELLNPLGQTLDRITKTQGMNGFYTFTTRTAHDAPTGNWTAVVKVGGAEFRQRIKIESIKPNRLKIDLAFDRKVISQNPVTRATLSSEWLHGATARNLKADVNVKLTSTRTRFQGWEGFTFDDPARRFDTEEKMIFDGRLDERGAVSFKIDLPGVTQAPGMLSAFFLTRVFEEGGDFSIDGIEKPFSPYSGYAGLKAPEMNRYKMLETGRDYLIQLASVDAFGSPQTNRTLKVDVYKIDWSWWWSAYERSIAQYMRQYSSKPYSTATAAVKDGRGSFKLNIPEGDWGRFYVKVSDPLSGHSTGEMWYFDWPSAAGRARRAAPEGAAMLTFTTDQEKYKPGDKAKITFPSAKDGSAIISIENGTQILNIFRVNTTDNETVVDLPVTREMMPNAFIHISLLQPHAQTVNDLPIRLYGILPLMVEDPATRLQPVIVMPDVLEPEKPFKVSISEKNKQEMTYTLAIVDEGLLSLTRFKTPDPWAKFYAREALGVKTWDVYDYVIGAFGGRFEQMFSIGGDEFIKADDANLVNRFKPVVKFLGPYTIGAGQKQELEIALPQYIGSVRTMIIAGNKQAYGFAEKQTPVRKPLMVLATLPRVLGPSESFSLPVTVFVMDPTIRNVEVSVQPTDIFTGEALTRTIPISEPGNQTIFFELKTLNKTGSGKVKVIASAGKESAAHDLEIGIRNPNTEVTTSARLLLEAGKNGTLDYSLFGLPGSDRLSMELSTIPPIDLSSRMRYLLQYPHGCLEQTVSGAFPQLFLSAVVTLNAAEQQRAERNIKDALQRLKSFQLPDGSFTSWPGSRFTDEWATNYAGHFLLEAELQGYALPHGIKNQWISYQQLAARAWGKTTPDTRYAYHQPDLVQAYRLFTLALAKSPETGAMNRLREQAGRTMSATWRLAATYALIGQQQAAVNLVKGLEKQVKEYPGSSNTYGSVERDQAMILETLIYMNQREDAYEILQQLSESLSSGMWMSTQTTAYSLLAVTRFLGSDKATHQIKAGYQLDNGSEVSISEVRKVMEINLTPGKRTGTVSIRNQGSTVLFARLFTEGIPAPGDEIASENNIRLSVRYLNAKGEEVDVNRLKQGTDIVAEVSVTNPSASRKLTDLALTHVFPSGWEIGNLRLFDQATSGALAFTHQDIRDDRVLTYFDLSALQKKVFKVNLTAAYRGRFYLPAPSLEAMYDRNIHSNGKGKWVEVVP